MFDTGQPAERATATSTSMPIISLNINFLPDRHRGRRLRFAPLRPWLMLLSFALLLIPSGRLHRAQAVQFGRVESELAAVSAALDSYQPLADERSRLEGRIAQAEAEMAEVEQAYEIVNIQLHRWSDLVPQLLAAAPAGVEVTTISQSGLEITIEGLAVGETLPAGYLDRLKALRAFDRAFIQHVTRIVLEDSQQAEIAPSPTAVAEADAGAPAVDSEAEPAVFGFEIYLQLSAPEQEPGSE